MREEKALARSCVHAGSSEPSPHADIKRTIISCADQFIVLIFVIEDHYFIFLFSIIYLKPKVTLHCYYIYLFWLLVSDILNVVNSYES